MKKMNLEKGIKIMMALFLCLSGFLSSFSLPIKAGSYNLSEEFDPEWQHAGTTAYGDATKMWINGKSDDNLVWCLQPNNRTLVGSQQEIEPGDIGLTQNQVRNIALIVYYGYRSRTHNNTNYFLVQNFIWKYLGESGRLVSNTYPNDNSWKSVYDDVMDDVKHFNDLPSFDGKNYTVNMGSTLTLKDENGVLNELIVKRVSGGTAKISGNSLLVTPDGSSNAMRIIFSRKMTLNQTKTNFIVRAGGIDSYGRKYQAVSPCLSGADPYNARVLFKVNLYGSLIITKQDEGGNKIPNTSFKLSPNADMSNALGTYTTGSDGTVTIEDLTPSTYYVQETAVPSPLILDKTIRKITIKPNETTAFTANNKWARGSLNIIKQDSVTGGTAQGEATLKGAVYGLYARNEILHPGDRSVVYAKGAEVARLTTDAAAKASISNLYLGNYYLKEITPSPGYTLDATEYDVSLTYKDQNTSVITKSQIVKERVISQAFSIIKVSNNGAAESDLLQGAEFTIKYKNDVEKYGSWEKAPVAKNADGKPASILVTDKKGYAVSDRLPIGTYVVREIKVPADHFKTNDFEVRITEDSKEPQPWRVFNDEKFKAVLSIVKQDKETGKTVLLADTEFKIKNLDTNAYIGFWIWNPVPHYVTTWKTDKSGTVMTDDELIPGHYQLEEIKSPEGYLINKEPVPFEISANTPYQTLPDGVTPVISVLQEDLSVKGRITVEKQGEVLVGAKQDEKGNYQFLYENKALEGAVFEVFAKEEIQSADHQKDIIYHKGELIETITTGIDGKAVTQLLPLGKYGVHETKAPNGFVLNTEEKEVTLSYKDQETAVVFADVVTVIDKRPTFDIQLTKTLEHPNIFKDETAYKDVLFGIYAREAIQDSNGNVIVAENTLICKSGINEEGHLTNIPDLPFGKYFIQEIQTNEQYLLDGTEYEFTIRYVDENNANSSILIGQDGNIENKLAHGSVKIQKVDALVKEISKRQGDTIKHLIGVEFAISIHEDMSDVIATTKTDEAGIATFANLELGTYYIQEMKQVDGYTLHDEIYKVEVTKDGELVEIEVANQPVEMLFSKVDTTTNKELAGAKLQVIDKESGTLIEEWISTDTPHHIHYLVENKTYILREITAPKTYTKAHDITFLAQHGKTVVMKDQRIVKYISVKTFDTSQKYILVLLLSLSTGFLFILKKKRRRNSE